METPGGGGALVAITTRKGVETVSINTFSFEKSLKMKRLARKIYSVIIGRGHTLCPSLYMGIGKQDRRDT